MPTINELPISDDDAQTLTNVEAAILSDEDFDAVEFSVQDDGSILIEAVYGGSPYIYHQDVHYGDSPGLRALELMEQNGVALPVENPRVGVKTSHQDEEVVVQNVFSPSEA